MYVQLTATIIRIRQSASVNAFRHTCPAGHSVFMQMHNQLGVCLWDPASAVDEFIDRTTSLHDELNEAL